MIALAICEIGSLAERRIAMLVDPALSRPAGIPDAEARAEFRVHDPAGDGGRAGRGEQAARHIRPASIRSRPRPTRRTMSRWPRTARAGCWRWRTMPAAVIGIELLAAAQGCDFHAPLTLQRLLERVRALVRAASAASRRGSPLAARHRRRRSRSSRRGALIEAVDGRAACRRITIGGCHDPHRQRPHHPRAARHRTSRPRAG